MHYADELVSTDEFRKPSGREPGAKELQMAKSLVDMMTEKWDPEKYHDDYKAALKKVIDEKIKHPKAALPHIKSERKPTNVVDLVAVLQESLRTAKQGGGAPKKKPAASKGKKHKKAA
jgi:DNA end-binding protein Ku